MKITWAEIEAEAGGYREGFVAIYKKYEGMDTDEVDSLGRAIKVSKSSFAQHMGIAERTFCRWVTNVENGSSAKMASDRPGNAWRDREAKIAEEAAAKAKAEAEATAQEQLAKALQVAEQEAARAKHLERVKHEQELAAQKEAARKEKLEALNRQAKQLKEEATSQGVDLSQLTQSDKSKLMVMLANDPEQAKDWFNAYNEERTRKLAEQHAKQKADAEKRRYQMEEREAREAARKASQDFDDSALHFFINKTVPQIEKLRHELSLKPITFTHMMYSGMTPHQLVELTNRCEDIIVQVREGLFSANAENELADLNQDTP